MGVAAGIAQAATDFVFHPELTPGQRAGRILLGAAVGVIAVAAAPVILTAAGITTTGIVGGALIFATATFISVGLQEKLVRPLIYPKLNLGR